MRWTLFYEVNVMKMYLAVSLIGNAFSFYLYNKIYPGQFV